MLITLKEMMEIAEKNGCAIGSFNSPNLASLESIMGAAEELKLPVIIQFAQCHENLISMKRIAPSMLNEARLAGVPVCVHLDHGETLDYIKEGLDLGFTSVMYDGSVLPYEENLKNTKKVVEMASAVGASVEAELGSMGKRESGSGDVEGEDETKIYTDPDMAREFVSETGIDALACSFGTTHGIYLKKPRLDFDVVRRVREKTGGIPVVMHGGSGVSREGFREAIRAGVRKVNYFTYMDKAGGSAAREWMDGLDGKPLFFSDIVVAAREAMKENIKEAMKIFALQE